MESAPKIESKETYYSRIDSRIRDQILAKVENHVEDINIERVAEFAKQHGLTLVPYKLIYPNQLKQVRQILQEDAINIGTPNQGSGGAYNTLVNIIFVLRDERERINGPEYTEGFLIHELVHGSTSYVVSFDSYVNKEETFGFGPIHFLSRSVKQHSVSLRTGFAHMKKLSAYTGYYLEEGVAEMMRAEYMRLYMNAETKKKMASMANVLQETFFDAYIRSTSSTGVTTDLIPELMYLDASGNKITTSISSIPASGLMKLCKNIPGLQEALAAARNDPNVLREVPKLINGFNKGLYPFLMKLQYAEEDFLKGTKKIQDILASR